MRLRTTGECHWLDCFALVQVLCWRQLQLLVGTWPSRSRASTDTATCIQLTSPPYQDHKLTKKRLCCL